ncbi:hypothetical protein Scep_010053 [Stephania cephalantha]|uniref:Uncharacterized protein n=1 Tax=Stephania cephalantha TaxID=152367 RepID=A0AAP0JWS2_9MAGN
MKLHLGNYLALKILEIKAFGSEMILHPCFVRSGRLKLYKSLKLIPPSFFLTQSLDQFIQFTPFFSDFFEPHQKEFIIFCRESHMDKRSRNGANTIK